MADEGYVYVLHNCEHRQPNVKIGRTTGNVERRAKRLDTTGSPGEFVPLFRLRVVDCRTVEKLVHEELAEFRIRRNREFFRVGPELAIRTLLTVAVPYLVEPLVPDRQIDVLPPLVERYGGLLDPTLRSAVVGPHRNAVVLSCTFNRTPWPADEIIERTDLSGLAGGPYDFNPSDPEEAAEDFLALEPLDYVLVTPLFAEREARLIDYLAGEGFETGELVADLTTAVQQVASEIRAGRIDPGALLQAYEAGDSMPFTDYVDTGDWRQRPQVPGS